MSCNLLILVETTDKLIWRRHTDQIKDLLKSTRTSSTEGFGDSEEVSPGNPGA